MQVQSISTTVPSATFSRSLEPCGSALPGPTCALLDARWPPYRVSSASMIALMSLPFIPARTWPCVARYAAIMMSLARCISAISAGLLIMRSALTGAAPETVLSSGSSRRTPSTMKKRVVSSTASVPAASFFSFSQPAISAKGLSSSCHTRTSPGTSSISRIDGSSKKGVTISTGPSAGITAAVVRSLRHQSTPVK